MKTRTTIKALALAALLAAATSPAQAADGIATRVAATLSGAIAAQGNAAFQQIREDLKQELVNQFESLLPASQDAGAEVSGEAEGKSSSDVQ